MSKTKKENFKKEDQDMEWTDDELDLIAEEMEDDEDYWREIIIEDLIDYYGSW